MEDINCMVQDTAGSRDQGQEIRGKRAGRNTTTECSLLNPFHPVSCMVDHVSYIFNHVLRAV